MNRSRLARAVVPAGKVSKSTKASAKKPAAAKAKTSDSPSAGKGLPRKARKPAMLPKSPGCARTSRRPQPKGTNMPLTTLDDSAALVVIDLQ